MRNRLFLLAVSITFITAAPVRTAQQRVITDTDLLKFVWVADPQVSPDGSQVAFVRVVVNEKTDDYDTSLWMVRADGRGEGPRELTTGTRDSSPRWSPDGKRLAFVRSAGGAAQIYVMSFSGGEPVPITDLPRGASGPSWSPDGLSIAFTSVTRDEDFAAKAAAPKSDVRVITSATYRANGGGWTDADRPSHVWVASTMPTRPLTRARQVTSGKYSEAFAAWSADGRSVLVTSTRVDEPYYQRSRSELFAVSAAGGNLNKLASIPGSIGAVRVSPEGRRLAYTCTFDGAAERSYDQPDLCVGASDGQGPPKNLTAAYDFDVNGGVGGDNAAPRGGRSAGPIWSPDGRSIVIVAGERGNANLVRIDAENGTVTPLLKGSQTVQSYTASVDGKTLVAVVSTQTSIGELFRIDLAGAAPVATQITHVNDELFSALKLSEPETLTWKSFDGRQIEGWLMKPPNFDPSKKYPFILEIHGGPHSAYGNVFTHEFQMLAAKGYVVLFPNPRGSSNYGQEFGNVIQYHYPGDDYKDLMAGVDEVVKRGYIDTTKLGVTGGSGGGLLTNWTVTQTTRFAAAVSQRDIADWYGFWFTADFTQFTPSWFRKAPWEDPEDYAARSPITHVGKVKTPMLFVLGDDDLRTPPSDGGEMMFRALKYMHIPTVMVRFPGETHELSRSGKPSHRIERLRHISGWFDRWLMGNTDLYRDVK